MRLFQRLPCDNLWAGHGVTSKATMCPEINRYENYGPVPKVVGHSHQAENPENLQPRMLVTFIRQDRGALVGANVESTNGPGRVLVPMSPASSGAAKTLVRRAPERLAS
jgi:hypothetical protein